MTVAEVRPDTHAEQQQPLLAAEVAYVRTLLEAHRRGDPPPRDPRAAVTAVAGQPEPAVDRVARVLGLSEFERQVVLLAAAVELDGEVAALTAEIQGGDPRPTFALALAALPFPHWDALGSGSPLRRWRVVELGPGPALAARPLRLDEHVLHHLTGVHAPDDRLDGILRAMPDASLLAPGQEAMACELAATVAAMGAPAVVDMDGDDVEARLDVVSRLAEVLGRRALLVRGAALPQPGPDLAGLVRLIDREALLLDGMPVLDADDTPAPVVRALLDLLGAPVVVVVGGPGSAVVGRVLLHRSADLPSPVEQRALWEVALGGDGALDLASTIDEVAHHYRLGTATVAAIGRELSAMAAAGHAEAAATTLRRLCRERARVRLDALARRLEPRAVWDDLILPEAHTELLREVARHVRHRARVYEEWGFGERTSGGGLGVTALFSGESGTGKTMAAEVLATDLELDLYRVDLSATVSKYIGETEKNLRRLFDAAEASGAILLFDEADALFARRSDVKDSHDRYANLEVAYLLQRMESYRGLAILTTNLRSNLDTAFLRRLRFVVQFPFPDVAGRAAIWRRVFPPEVPLDGIDPDRLAQLNAAGGSIRSIAVSAAFAAAEEGTAVTTTHVLRAARLEYAKAERTLTTTETAGLS